MHIQIEGISKSYKGQVVLDQINVEFVEGKIYCLIGKNGAGKSTLFNLLGGLIRHEGGRIKYDGAAFQDLPVATKQKLGLMTETSSLIEDLTAFQYLDLIGRFYGLKQAYREERIGKWMSYFSPMRKTFIKKR